MIRRLFLLLIFVTLTTGCAMTDDTLKLRYDAPANTPKLQSLPDISINKWTDSRKADDPKFVYYKNNNYGKTMGRLISEDVAVSDFVTNVVRKTLQQAGINVVDNSDFVLSGRILSLDSVAKIGFWSATVDSVMHGEIQLTKAGRLVNKTAFVDKGTSEDSQVIRISDYEESLQKMFNNFSITMIDFLKSSAEQKPSP